MRGTARGESRATSCLPAVRALLRRAWRECYVDSLAGGHQCSHHADPSDEQLSTGFLPISLALTLLVSGLFVFGIIPMSCNAAASTRAPYGQPGASSETSSNR